MKKAIFGVLFVCFGCANAQLLGSTYPDHWWKPAENLASWEIGPQAADRSKNEVILSKRNELGRLSNFYAAQFEYEGEVYGSIEGFWQAMKYPENTQDARNSKKVTWAFTRKQVQMMSAFEAKHAGDAAGENMKKLGIDWISYQGQRLHYKGKDQQKHYELIYEATMQKVLQNSEVKETLLATGELQLMPDHHQPAGVPPAYRYYEIAMRIRSEIR